MICVLPISLSLAPLEAGVLLLISLSMSKTLVSNTTIFLINCFDRIRSPGSEMTVVRVRMNLANAICSKKNVKSCTDLISIFFQPTVRTILNYRLTLLQIMDVHFNNEIMYSLKHLRMSFSTTLGMVFLVSHLFKENRVGFTLSFCKRSW